MSSADREILRDLAKKYIEVCQKDVQRKRRDLWRRHNSLKPTRPLVFAGHSAVREIPHLEPQGEDPFYRGYEGHFRRLLFFDTFNDDRVFEPWVTVQATRLTPKDGLWGLPIQWIDSHVPGGARRLDPQIKDPEDIQKLLVPRHAIDEEKTARDVARLQDAIGDIITVAVDRKPEWSNWGADISTYLGYMRGVEQIMWDMTDRPAWLHELLGFMRDGILKAQQEAEDAGDWALLDHENQAVPYADELSDPAANGGAVTRDKLWCFCASQETTLISPAMFDEFMVQYQKPIVEKFGLTAYGCCEDLTQKIDVLRQIKNLRRIAVTPAANVAKCAEQIGTDYVLSYRPSPADMVCYGFDPDRIHRILRRDLKA
ncbi:MAG: hypothetical protein QGD94_12340, partial [Planctomycetia bacterium]|nr:hypothetical protein [Planctomycetia bacterium]